MEKTKTKKGIIYCRVSSTEQVDNTSLESQERYCREYAQREGIEIIEAFIEKGESAKTANRTEFIKAVNFCGNKKNNITHFIVYKLDRFSRNQNDHVVTQTTLKRYGVVLRSVTEPIDETPIGKVMEGVISVFAEFDNNIRTERSKGGMMEKVKKGVWVWQAPIGYYRIRQGSNLTPESSTSPYILMIFEEYAKGIHTYESIAKYVFERGFKTKQGKIPHAQLMEKILKNSLYCGKIRVWGLDVKGDFEAIVSEDLFIQCQKGYKRAYTKINHTTQNQYFPLRRKILCAHCQIALTGSFSKKIYPYYHHQKQGCLQAKFIPKETLDALFVKCLNEITPSVKFEKIFKAIVMDIWQTNYKRMDENNAKVRIEIERLEQERQKIFDLHREGKYSDDEFLEQKEITRRKMNGKRQLLQDNHIEEFNMEEALNYCFNFIRETAKTWERLKNKNYNLTIKFQNQIFPEKLTFDGEKFGTNKLSIIYKINQQSGAEKSQLVCRSRGC